MGLLNSWLSARALFDVHRCLWLLVLLVTPAQLECHPSDSGTELRSGYVDVVQTALPAVVNISARRIVETWTSPFANEPFWRFFRQHGQVRQRVENSLGSGVIASSDGYVVTNYHVVEGALEILVELSDRREVEARVVLVDRRFDLAVLKLDEVANLQTLTMRDSDTLQIGELVLAVGNPFGIGQTVSSGIVSGFLASSGYFVQTDAPIYSGNSGGALVDTKGRLVGINTMIQTEEGNLRGIGFAIPSNLVEVFVEQARSGAQRFNVPWAGIDAMGVERSLAQDLGMERPSGVVIGTIHRESPLWTGGLRPGDIIIRVGDRDIHTPAELRYRIAIGQPGDTIQFGILRNGRARTINARLGLASENPPRQTTTIDYLTVFRGLIICNVNPATIVEFELPLDARGIMVVEVPKQLSGIGLMSGDILLRINGRRIESIRDVVSVVRSNTRAWEVEVRRGSWKRVFRFRS